MEYLEICTFKQYQLHMDSRRKIIKPWVGVGMVPSGSTAGVADDASVRDKNAVSGISNNVISMVLYTIIANFVDNAMGWSTRNKQLHTEERSMKSSPCGCSDDLALVWLALQHLASCNVTRIVVLNRGHPCRPSKLAHHCSCQISAHRFFQCS